MDHLIEEKNRFINKLFRLALDGFPSGKFFPFQLFSFRSFLWLILTQIRETVEETSVKKEAKTLRNELWRVKVIYYQPRSFQGYLSSPRDGIKKRLLSKKNKTYKVDKVDKRRRQQQKTFRAQPANSNKHTKSTNSMKNCSKKIYMQNHTQSKNNKNRMKTS